MNKPRFQLPPRADSGAAIDRWVTGEAGSRRNDAKLALISGKPPEMPASMSFPFLFGMTAFLAAHRRNMEAFWAANRVVNEGAQAVARRNLGIMQETIDRVSEHMQTMGSPECPRDRAMRQTETAIKAYEGATANLRELGETIQRTNTETIEVLGRRVSEAADEMKSLARHVTRSFWDFEATPGPFWEHT